jgi:glycosyltransferase involved in cell wall biosynthesis
VKRPADASKDANRDDANRRIAVLIWSSASFGGAERRFARLAAELNARPGFQVTLFCLRRSLPALKALGLDTESLDITTIDLRRDGGGGAMLRLAALVNFLSLVRHGGFDRLFMAMNPGMLTYLVTRFRPWLPKTSMAMVDLLHATHAGPVYRYFVRRSVARAYSVDCLSEGVLEAFGSSIAPEDRARISIAPGSFTDYSQVKSSEGRDIDVVLMSRLTPLKGHDLLEQAAGKLSGIILHICGSGPLRVNVPGALIYATDDPFAVLARAKISLSLQRLGNYPSQVVLESMASGCAIIATDTGETRKFLDETCAVLIPDDADALAEAIAALLADSQRRQALADAARLRVLRDHTVERYADYFEQEILA